ncbi:uncharacterized protein LOC130732211 [Lotus japonicus]|uniref:uncharacterized protein LOC130732211 n=1 Tax=Lotus japonicus TaxID=34305 RepID=UPI002583DF21|nr:uncharacterized protein LOC130732211 [Lotus japonicus]
MCSLHLRLSKVTSLALPSESDPKVDKELEEKSGGVIHAVVSYLRKVLVFTLSYILAPLIDPINLRFYLNPNGNLYSQWEARLLFHSWCKEYSKTYPTKDEKLYRFDIFNQTLERTTRRTLTTSNSSSGTNGFADRTAEELDYLLPSGGYADSSDSD